MTSLQVRDIIGSLLKGDFMKYYITEYADALANTRITKPYYRTSKVILGLISERRLVDSEEKEKIVNEVLQPYTKLKVRLAPQGYHYAFHTFDIPKDVCKQLEERYKQVRREKRKLKAESNNSDEDLLIR